MAKTNLEFMESDRWPVLVQRAYGHETQIRMEEWPPASGKDFFTLSEPKWFINLVKVNGDNDISEQVLGASPSPQKLMVPFLRLAEKHGFKVTKDMKEELGQWAIWAEVGKPEQRHSRE